MMDYVTQSFQETAHIVIRLFLRKDNDMMEIMIDMINNGVGMTNKRVGNIARLFESDDSEVLDEDVSLDDIAIELRTAHRIVRSLGGKLGINSAFSKGTVLSIHLTAGCIADKDEAAVSDVISQQRIMIIEELRSTQEIAMNYLRAKGLMVDEFHRGADAIRAAGQSKYTMIFVDNDLPDMSGAAVAKEIRALPEHKHTPLIAMVVDQVALMDERLLEAAFNDKLQKPVTGNQLYNIAEGYSKMTEKILSFTK